MGAPGNLRRREIRGNFRAPAANDFPSGSGVMADCRNEEPALALARAGLLFRAGLIRLRCLSCRRPISPLPLRAAARRCPPAGAHSPKAASRSATVASTGMRRESGTHEIAGLRARLRRSIHSPLWATASSCHSKMPVVHPLHPARLRETVVKILSGRRLAAVKRREPSFRSARPLSRRVRKPAGPRPGGD
jgi:hypothetical protein